jgi:hypothetical protein
MDRNGSNLDTNFVAEDKVKIDRPQSETICYKKNLEKKLHFEVLQLFNKAKNKQKYNIRKIIATKSHLKLIFSKLKLPGLG